MNTHTGSGIVLDHNYFWKPNSLHEIIKKILFHNNKLHQHILIADIIAVSVVYYFMLNEEVVKDGDFFSHFYNNWLAATGLKKWPHHTIIDHHIHQLCRNSKWMAP